MTKSTNLTRTRQIKTKDGASDRAWTHDEVSILREWYPKGGYGALARRLPKRSKSSIYSMANLLSLKTRKVPKPPKVMEPSQIAKGLGVPAEMVVQWIGSKELESKIRRGRHIVTAAALRRWITAHHHKHVDLALVDRAWFMALAFPAANPDQDASITPCGSVWAGRANCGPHLTSLHR